MKFALKIPEICITLEAYIQSENSLNNVNDDKDNDNDEFTIDIPEKEME